MHSPRSSRGTWQRSHVGPARAYWNLWLTMFLIGIWHGASWTFVWYAVLQSLAMVTHLIARALGGKGTGYGARMALFWSFLAASPLILLHGLVAGFVGPGPQLQIVGVIWVLVFGWFWVMNLREAEWGGA